MFVGIIVSGDRGPSTPCPPEQLCSEGESSRLCGSRSVNILTCSACGCHSSSPVTSCLLGITERKPGLTWQLAADSEKEEREGEGGGQT